MMLEYVYMFIVCLFRTDDNTNVDMSIVGKLLNVCHKAYLLELATSEMFSLNWFLKHYFQLAMLASH